MKKTQREFLILMEVSGTRLVLVKANSEKEAEEKANKLDWEEETDSDIKDWEILEVRENK